MYYNIAMDTCHCYSVKNCCGHCKLYISHTLNRKIGTSCIHHGEAMGDANLSLGCEIKFLRAVSLGCKMDARP